MILTREKSILTSAIASINIDLFSGQYHTMSIHSKVHNCIIIHNKMTLKTSVSLTNKDKSGILEISAFPA